MRHNNHCVRVLLITVSIVLLFASGLTDATAFGRSPAKAGKTFAAPRITPATITRVKGAPAKRSVIATVSDAETPAGALTVAVIGGSAFVSVIGLVNDNGSVSADVAVNCVPPPGLQIVILQVTDGDGLTQNGALRVNVVEAALSYFSPAPVGFNSARDVTPVAPPEGFASLSVDAPNFKGDISVDQTTGVVNISRARPTGSYTVTVTATNLCGVVSVRSFPLTTPVFSQLLSAGKDWRMVFHASNDLGLSGLALNRGPVKLNKNLLNPLALTRAASLTMPVFPAIGC
jgi:hypothetical protein